MSMEHRKDGVIDQVKYRKRVSKRKWTDREYHVQDNADVLHKDVKIYCDKKPIPSIKILWFTYKASWIKGVG